MKNEKYISPAIEVIELEIEDVLCASGVPSNSTTMNSIGYGGEL